MCAHPCAVAGALLRIPAVRLVSCHGLAALTATQLRFSLPDLVLFLQSP